jgi:Flp pilus assembly protein TadB
MFRFTIRDVLEATGIGFAAGLFCALLGVGPLTTISFAVGGAVLGFVWYLATRTSRQKSN